MIFQPMSQKYGLTFSSTGCLCFWKISSRIKGQKYRIKRNKEKKEGYSLDRNKMTEWIWPKSVNMIKKLTTTNINMVNMTKNIINITTTTNINKWYDQKSYFTFIKAPKNLQISPIQIHFFIFLLANVLEPFFSL